jgi:hypothetical protein
VKYKLLFTFMAADFAQSVFLMGVGYQTTAYATIYFPTQGIKISFAALLLIEIYSFVLQDRPALARFGRATVGYVLLAAALLAASGLLWDAPAAPTKQPLAASNEHAGVVQLAIDPTVEEIHPRAGRA